jgi:hypothetical protein
MRRHLAVVALTLALPLAACADSTAPEDTLSGTYTLETINGASLPWLAVDEAEGKVEVAGGSITLLADGTFTDRMTFRVTEGGVARSEDDTYTGTYIKTATGATLTPLAPVGFDPYMVTVSGSTMTQMINDFELTYRK